MPILRLYPGDEAPWDGQYALVGHYGEATNHSEWRDAGDRLSVITGSGDHGPFWFVFVYEANELARVG